MMELMQNGEHTKIFGSSSVNSGTKSKLCEDTKSAWTI